LLDLSIDQVSDSSSLLSIEPPSSESSLLPDDDDDDDDEEEEPPSSPSCGDPLAHMIAEVGNTNNKVTIKTNSKLVILYMFLL